MHDAFIVLLIGVLVASVISFAIMGLLQRRRTRSLARKAHEMGMRFSPDDPFDMPRRYAGFALMGSGHSPRASNVTYGRLDGQPIRAFDFRYEVGHGTRRLTRHYSVIVSETDAPPMPPLLMWHEQDAECAPAAVRSSDGQVACWRYVGSVATASALAEACRPLAEDGLSVQIFETAIMFCVPKRRNRPYSDRLGDLAAIVARIGLFRAGATVPSQPAIGAA